MCENNGQTVLSSPKEPTQSESIAKLAGALAKAQGEIHGAKKDADNPFISKQRPGAGQYATLHSVWEACRESLSNNGLAVIQTTGNSANGIMVITTLVHSSGEWIRGSLDLPLVKKDPQTVGSVITYGRRYTLAAITGVAPGDDDDAEKAMEEHRNGTGQKQPNKKLDDVAVPQIETISHRIKKCKAIPELENVWKKHVSSVTWQQDEYAMLKNLAASRKAEIIAELKAKESPADSMTPAKDGMPDGGDFPDEKEPPKEGSLQWYKLEIDAAITALKEIDSDCYSQKKIDGWIKDAGLESLWKAKATDKDTLKKLLAYVRLELQTATEPVTA